MASRTVVRINITSVELWLNYFEKNSYKSLMINSLRFKQVALFPLLLNLFNFCK